MENTNEKLVEEKAEVTTGSKFLNGAKNLWRKTRGPIIGGLAGLTAGFMLFAGLGMKAAKEEAAAMEANEAETENTNDVPFDEDK